MDTNKNSKHSLTGYFLAAFAFSWFFWLFGVLASKGLIESPLPNMVWIVLGAHGPLAVALGMTFRDQGWTGVKRLLRAGFQVRIALVYWFASLLLPFALAALAVGVNVTLNGYSFDQTLLSQPMQILPTFLIMFFLGGSVQEEFGWRGYALPRLLARWNPLIATLILGAVWAAWHLPLFLIEGASQSYMSFGIFFFLGIGFSFLFTWIYLRTGQNLFSALLLHTAINTALNVFPPVELKVGGDNRAMVFLMVAYAVVAFVLVMMNQGDWLEGMKFPRRALRPEG